jgi:hypothetical protein
LPSSSIYSGKTSTAYNAEPEYLVIAGIKTAAYAVNNFPGTT